MNNHVLIPTNLNDITDTLTKNAKIVLAYGCLTQCDSWGILTYQSKLMSYKIGLEQHEVVEGVAELDKAGLIVIFNHDTLIAIMDFVMWNHFQFIKINKKVCQWDKEVQVAIKEGELYEGWIELPTIPLKKKEKYLKSINSSRQVQVQEEVQADTKHSNTKEIVSTSTCTSTSDSESLIDSSSSSNPYDKADELIKKFAKENGKTIPSVVDVLDYDDEGNLVSDNESRQEEYDKARKESEVIDEKDLPF
jgi:hypothetical protein